jgi:hypothetical protein
VQGYCGPLLLRCLRHLLCQGLLLGQPQLLLLLGQPQLLLLLVLLCQVQPLQHQGG